MVDEICKLKNDLLGQARKELDERGPDRLDVNRMGMMIDMIKDLAEAEKDCWKAQYYRNLVTEAMEKKYGYGATRTSYEQHQSDNVDIVGKLSEEYRRLAPSEKMMMKNQILAAME